MRAPAVVLACIGVSLALGVAARSAAGPTPSFAATAWYRVSPNPSSVLIRDLNGDGKPDLAIANAWLDYEDYANNGIGTVSVRLNRGDGTFLPRRDYRTGAGSASVSGGDLNGDGTPDLVTANTDGGTDAGSVSVLIGRGDGGFLAAHDYPAGEGAGAVAVGDLNGDHKPDVVSTGGNAVSVFFNTGDGGLRPKVDYSTGKGPSSVAIADVDGDGHLDLVTANIEAGTISVLRNAGDGTFEPSRDYACGSFPVSVATGDFNGDGKPDLAVAHYGERSASVLLNAGDGTFGAPRAYRVGHVEQGAIAVGDLNGDGKPDLAASYGGGISALLNLGDGTFEPALRYRGGSDYGAVAVGDLNADGRADIVAAAGSGDDESAGVVELAVLIAKPGFCNVQNVSRLTLAAATQQLARADCSVGKVAWKYSSSVKRGREISQSPAFGAVLPAGGKVNLVMSKGRR